MSAGCSTETKCNSHGAISSPSSRGTASRRSSARSSRSTKSPTRIAPSMSGATSAKSSSTCDSRSKQRRSSMRSFVGAAALCAILSSPLFAQQGTVVEFPVNYPNLPSVETGACHPAPKGSTHEITFNKSGGNTLWVTGQNYDQVVKVTESGAMTFYPQPNKSGPHGIEFDRDGRLWVTWEFAGQIVRLDANGNPDRTIDVRLDCSTCPGGKLNTSPHGLGFGIDGKTIWFTGKATGTVGKVTPDGKVTTYPLATVGSVPIYVRAGNDGTMWVTEL